MNCVEFCQIQSNIMTRHAFMINGMNEQCANFGAQNLRTEILMGKKA